MYFRYRQSGTQLQPRISDLCYDLVIANLSPSHLCRSCISQGVKLIKANHPSLEPLFIFLSPPSLSELRKRLSGRGTETAEAVAARLGASTTEIEYARTPGAYHAVVVNDDLDSAYEKLKRCIVLGQWQEVGNEVPEMKEDPEEVAQQTV